MRMHHTRSNEPKGAVDGIKASLSIMKGLEEIAVHQSRVPLYESRTVRNASRLCPLPILRIESRLFPVDQRLDLRLDTLLRDDDVGRVDVAVGEDDGRQVGKPCTEPRELFDGLLGPFRMDETYDGVMECRNRGERTGWDGVPLE